VTSPPSHGRSKVCSDQVCGRQIRPDGFSLRLQSMKTARGARPPARSAYPPLLPFHARRQFHKPLAANACLGTNGGTQLQVKEAKIGKLRTSIT
jgi:hypothetical protein